MMRRLLYFLHISSLLCRTTVWSLAIGRILLCFCILLSMIDFKPLRLPIRFQKWWSSGF